MPTSSYAALHVTTNFSFLHGASHPDELVETAKRLGLEAIAVTDYNTLAGVVRMHIAAKKVDMRLIIGVRLVLNDATDLLCFPKNRAAYGRLSRLLSLGQRRAKKGQCNLSLADVAAHQKGQIFIALPPPQTDLSCFGEQLQSFKTHLIEPLYLALAHSYCGYEQTYFHALHELGARYKLPLIAASQVLYHEANRKSLADILICIREKCTISNAGLRLSPNGESHLKQPTEMKRLYKGYEEALARTIEIADHCRFSLDELSYDYPREPVPEGSTAQQHLEKLSYAGAAWRYPQGLPAKVQASLQHELKLIDELNYAPYFLTVHDIVSFARRQDILCQGRGSAANSVVCYCLDITNVDPTKIDLLFARFISSERDEPPDIDVDFEHERREEVIQYIYQRFGREHAGLAATLITYRPRSAVRDVGKAMGLSQDIVSRLAGTVWGWGGKNISVKRVLEAGLNPDDPRLIRTLQLTAEIMGFPRHLSQHVGGFVLTHSPLCELVPIGNAAMKDRTVIEWDKTDLAALGLLKIDVLALGMLSCVHRSFDLIEKHYNRPLTLDSVPREDSKTYDMICKADTVGIFQIESRAQMNMLPRLKPRIFYDLVIEVAIVRPGPIQGDMVHPYLRRRDGLEEEIYPAPDPRFGPADELRTILGKTKGVPLFQEQAMRLAMVAADFSPAEANALRKSMATFRHRGTIELLQDKMVERMVTRGYEREFAERCFSQIKGFGDYGFPESHAASFAHLVYISSWIKCHYPAVFACALLNSQPMGFYAPAQIVRDAREHGVKVLPIDVSISDWDCTLEDGTNGVWALRLGMRQVSGLRRDETKKIVAARSFAHPTNNKQPAFSDMEELRSRSKVRRETLEKLAEADAFRSMGLERRTALWHIRGLSNTAPLPLFVHANARELPCEPSVKLPRLPLSAHVLEDYRSTRLSLKAHPMFFLRPRLQEQKTITCLDLQSLRDGDFVKLSGVVLIRQRPGSSKGVVFMTIEDETGIANLVIWSKVMEKFRKTVMTARLIQVQGRLQRHQDILHVVANRLLDQSHWLSLLDENVGQSMKTEEPEQLPAARRTHPRNVRIIPKSRDFH